MPAVFTIKRRVEFGDTDMAGIVHFSNFFRYMEVAETDFLHSLGFSVSGHSQEGKWGFPRVSAACEYLAPARFEDVLAISVIVERVGSKSVSYRFDFSNARGGVAVGRTTAVFCRSRVDGSFLSAEIPNDLRTLLLERIVA